MSLLLPGSVTSAWLRFTPPIMDVVPFRRLSGISRMIRTPNVYALA